VTAVTRIIERLQQGDSSAADPLLRAVYDELRRLAGDKLARERSGQTLQATALVHEAYLRLVDSPSTQPWSGRAHFFAAAAEAMRRILIENARRKQRLKHGGGEQRIPLDSECAVSDGPSLDLVALDEALAKLTRSEPDKAQLVKLRYFAGLTMPEAAAAMDISLATAERHWTFAKAWLFAELADRP
jgi:RNA polymerase sigma factor (TIGR02999 family)